MRRVLPLLLLVVSCSKPPLPALAITDVTVINPGDGSRAAHLTVLIRGDRIESVGKATLPPGTRAIDGRGRFLIPGLWNMNVHLWHPRDLAPYLGEGVTTVRSIGGRTLQIAKWRDQIAAGTLAGPRIIYAGPVLDGGRSTGRDSVIFVRDQSDASGAVRGIAGSGADLITVGDRLSRNAFFTIAEEAQRRQIPFGGHVPDAVTVAEASEAGMSSIEDLDGIAVTPELVTMLVSNRTWQVPALVNKPEGSLAIASALHKGGVRFLAGTDSAGSIHAELELLVRAGFTPLEALRTATTGPAEFLGLADHGRIAPGAVANLVMLDADPLADIRNTAKVAVTIAAGKVYPSPSTQK